MPHTMIHRRMEDDGQRRSHPPVPSDADVAASVKRAIADAQRLAAEHGEPAEVRPGSLADVLTRAGVQGLTGTDG